MLSLLAILFSTVVSILLYRYFLYPVFISPLSKIPCAHFTASFCPAWILWVRYSRIENRTLLSCHKRLGQVIRLGPNEVSVNCVDGGVRTIYTGDFEKPDWYVNRFGTYGVLNMFSTKRSKPHSIRKRMMSNLYSKSYLQSCPQMQEISQTVLFDRLLPQLDSLVQGKCSVNVFELNCSIAMDFISAHLFGLSNSTNFVQDAKYRQHWLRLWRARRSYPFWSGELPRVRAVFSTLGVRFEPKHVAPMRREIEDWCQDMCRAAAKEIAMPEVTSASPTVYRQVSEGWEKASSMIEQALPQQPRDLSVASEMLDALLAGQEGTAITFTYVMHCLSRRPALQMSLRQELFSLSPNLRHECSAASRHALPSPRSVDALPLLHSVLMETLRLYGPLAGPQPRVTPHNPATPTKLGGYTNIPGGVRVSAAVHVLHRNPHVFPEPESWKPERWLNVGKDGKDEMMRWFWAFGSGGRMCIGSHFAMQEIKLVIAAIYTNYATTIIDDQGIEQSDEYSAPPVGKRLILGFERVD